MTYLALTLPGGKTITSGGAIPTGGIDIVRKVISNSITIALILGVILCLFFLIFGGMQWITSTGDKSKVGAARAKITYAIVGLIVILLSFGIIAVMGGLFGLNLLQL